MPWRRTPHSKRGGSTAAGGSSASTAAAAEVNHSKGVSGGVDGSVQAAPPGLTQQQFAYYVWVSEVMLQQTQASHGLVAVALAIPSALIHAYHAPMPLTLPHAPCPQP